ncbi:hydroxyurea phosphotransferase [Streptomyces sp. ISL-36]|uniref:aminoglycoside phosphotransferase family protein n=1 Tax=Streptomyces sp. ISL-36 TaxID=2819182 RepID=UPI001BE61BEC|nr:aminoglycoside phosphotransferase family protein [Streptomyces sp. ISL-36]MBT2439639.1 hydroxyurea phosphotransferase [Streptomyces sp. ISL-36]
MIHGPILVPEELAQSQARFNGDAGRAFVAGLPELAARWLDRWGLRQTGPSMYGAASLVLPVTRTSDGTRAALKMRLVDEESAGEAAGLRMWGGRGSVRLLDEDPETGTLLLERLDEGRHLSTLGDTRQATRILAELLARLVAVPAPAGLRRLADIAAAMLVDVPEAAGRLGEEDARLLKDCAAAVREVVGEPGDRLLHWDLHTDNILAADREPWLAIDPKPLVGDPGFDLMPALTSGFDPDPAETLWRFDLLTEVLGLDRARAAAWTLGRVLQNGLWAVEDGEDALGEEQVSIARTLLARAS